jgi:hypothetical protein
MLWTQEKKRASSGLREVFCRRILFDSISMLWKLEEILYKTKGVPEIIDRRMSLFFGNRETKHL